MLTPEGVLLIADGFTAIRRWNGLSTSIVDAGVPGPATAVAVGGSSTGDIAGTITAYQRWLDAEGNPSNFSPVSNEYEITGDSGSITGATNATPIVITSTGHGLSNTNVVKITGVTGNLSANGIWVIANVATDTFELVSSAGTGTYTGGGEWNQGVGQIDYSSVDAPTDARVVTREIWRTKTGDANTVYKDVTSTNLVDTTFSSTNSDDDLGDVGVALTDADGQDNGLTKYTEPPDWRPYLAHLAGRAIGSGDPVYTRGCVVMTNGSPTVTGVGTEWTSAVAGRELWVQGSTLAYTISTVNTSTQVLTLSANYAGSTAQFARYAIRMPPGYRKSFEWSAALVPEGWDPDNLQEFPEDSLSGVITGLVAHSRYVYIFCESRIYRLTFQSDPGSDGYTAPAPQRGMVNSRAYAIVDDYLRVLDRQGVYEFSGNDLRDASAAIQEAFFPDGDSKYKINWRWSKYFHTVHDPEQEVIRFYVSLGGRYPRHCFVYAYRARKWWIEEYPTGITSSALGRLDGRRQVFLGCESRQVVALNRGDSDGPDSTSGTLRGTCTSAGMTWIADTGATFPPSSQLVNTALRIVSGKGKGQWRKIVSVSGTTLNVDHPWLNVPDTTSVYQLGGINWKWRSGWHRWFQQDPESERAVEMVFDPLDNQSQTTLRMYRDRSESAYEWGITLTSDDNRGIAVESGSSDLEIDMRKANGFVRQQLDGSMETETDGNRFVSLELEGVTNAERQTVYDLRLEGAV